MDDETGLQKYYAMVSITKTRLKLQKSTQRLCSFPKSVCLTLKHSSQVVCITSLAYDLFSQSILESKLGVEHVKKSHANTSFQITSHLVLRLGLSTAPVQQTKILTVKIVPTNATSIDMVKISSHKLHPFRSVWQ